MRGLMRARELKELLAEAHHAKVHYKTFDGEDLSGMNLREVSFVGSTFYRCNMERAHLDGCNLYNANFREANLSYASLHEVKANSACFAGANLRDTVANRASFNNAAFDGANMSAVFFLACDFYRATFRSANLTHANLAQSRFHSAVFAEAIMDGVTLNGCDLFAASLLKAKIGYVHFNHETRGWLPAPQGELIAWGQKGGHIVKLRIPKEAKRSWATTSKLRCEYAEVLKVEKGPCGGPLRFKTDGDEPVPYTYSNGLCYTEYVEGQMVYPDSFDDDRWNECSNGIHCFLNREEAELWC